MYDLSILIPARNEQFLAKTIESLLESIQGNTEIIAVLDGQWADPPIPDNDRVTLIYNHEAVGQRAATNQAARLSKAKYVMKVDAHCAFDNGFDVKLMKDMQDDWTVVPRMYNLHAFDWVCTCGNRIYQGPTPEKCEKCGGKMQKEMIWKPRLSKESIFYRFDTTLHFQYHGERKHTKDNENMLVETMSLQGSCFMLTRKKYWELNICDENFGSWGQQGTEVACKTWLSGGKVIVNKNTWYSHMFRTQGGDFGFPYPLSQRAVDHARKYSKELFFNNTWDKQIYPLSYLIEKFKPLPDWHEESGKEVLDMVNKKGEEFYKLHKPMNQELTKNIIYFTDNKLNLRIAHAVQSQLKRMNIPIVSASLKPMPHFGTNIHLPLERGYLTMFKQILAALEASKADIVYFCEHDVLYHPSHFKLMPNERGTIYYNINVWKVRSSDGHSLWVNNCRQVSGIVAYREDLLAHYRERVAYVEKHGFSRNMGFEPGTHKRVEWQYPLNAESIMSEYPNLDIRHESNLTPNRWSPDQWRDKRNCEGWSERHVLDIEGWDVIPFKFNSLDHI